MQIGIQDSFAFDATLGKKHSKKLANICKYIVSSLHDEIFLDSEKCNKSRKSGRNLGFGLAGGIKLWGKEDSAIDILKNITAILTKMGSDSSRCDANKLRTQHLSAKKNNAKNINGTATSGVNGANSVNGANAANNLPNNDKNDTLINLSPVDIQMVMEFCENYKVEQEQSQRLKD